MKWQKNIKKNIKKKRREWLMKQWKIEEESENSDT